MRKQALCEDLGGENQDGRRKGRVQPLEGVRCARPGLARSGLEQVHWAEDRERIQALSP